MTGANRRTIRTAVQVLLGLAAGLPLLVDTAGLPATLPGVGTALAVAAAVTRVMALPTVESWLPAWLRTPTPPPLTVVKPSTN